MASNLQIGGVLSTIESAVALEATVPLLANADNAKDPDTKKKLTPEEIDALKTELTSAIVVTVLYIFRSSLSFVMGIVLLRGVLRKNTGFICAWMVYTIIAAIFLRVMALVETSKTAGDQFVAYLIGLALGLAIQGFCVWVVGIHKNEIDAQAETLQSAEVQYDVRKASI